MKSSYIRKDILAVIVLQTLLYIFEVPGAALIVSPLAVLLTIGRWSAWMRDVSVFKVMAFCGLLPMVAGISSMLVGAAMQPGMDLFSQVLFSSIGMTVFFYGARFSTTFANKHLLKLNGT